MDSLVTLGIAIFGGIAYLAFNKRKEWDRFRTGAMLGIAVVGGSCLVADILLEYYGNNFLPLRLAVVGGEAAAMLLAVWIYILSQLTDD